jgi:hypothetical protein
LNYFQGECVILIVASAVSEFVRERHRDTVRMNVGPKAGPDEPNNEAARSHAYRRSS